MSKFLKLRQWLDIHDSATHLTEVFTEQVVESDLIQLALEGRLTLSVRFASPVYGRLVLPDGAATEDCVYLVGSILPLSGPVQTFDGIFDLPFIGGEKALLRSAEWSGIGCLAEEMSFDEVLLKTGDGQLFLLLEQKSTEKWIKPFDSPENYCPTYRLLPSAAQLVIRTEALRRLQDATLVEDQSSLVKSVSPREKTTYLNIIGGLLGLMLGKSPAGQSQSVFASQAAVIAALLAHYGGKPGISDTTLEAKFAEAKRTLQGT